MIGRSHDHDITFKLFSYEGSQTQQPEQSYINLDPFEADPIIHHHQFIDILRTQQLKRYHPLLRTIPRLGYT